MEEFKMKKICFVLENHYRVVCSLMYISFIVGTIMIFKNAYPRLGYLLVGAPPLLMAILTRNIGTEKRLDKIMKILNDK